MSFNIRYAAADDGENSWDRRRALAIARIRAFDPDLLGLQECQDDAQAEYVRGQLADYECHGVRRDREKWSSEMAPLLYKTSVFEEIRRGHFWLSDTPDLPGSRGWDSWFARTVAWVELRQRSSRRSLFFVNTHFDYARHASEESARLLARWIDRSVGRQPVIVTGDFNATKDTAAYERLAGAGVLFDVYRQVDPDRYREITYHGYGVSEEATPLDWILASEHFAASAAGVDSYHEDVLYPSDHFPVTALLEWRA